MNLNLGSGISGKAALSVVTRDPSAWKSIDICPLFEADEHYDLTAGIREPDGSVDEIWMGDVLEHIQRAKAKLVVSECFRVLKDGGRVRISVPDMAKVMPIWLSSAGTTGSDLIWGQQGEAIGCNHVPDSHFNGFTEASLTSLLIDAGFEAVERVTIHGVWYELAVQARKPGA